MEGISFTLMRPQKDDLVTEFNMIYEKLVINEAKKEEDWNVQISIFEKDKESEEFKKNEEKERIGVFVDTLNELGIVIFDSYTTSRLVMKTDDNIRPIIAKSPYNKEALTLEIEGVVLSYRELKIKLGYLKSKKHPVKIIMQLLFTPGVYNYECFKELKRDWFDKVFFSNLLFEETIIPQPHGKKVWSTMKQEEQMKYKDEFFKRHCQVDEEIKKYDVIQNELEYCDEKMNYLQIYYTILLFYIKETLIQ